MTRQRVGGYAWRETLQVVLARERDEARQLRQLMQYAKTVDTATLIAGMLATKTETIDDLHRLLADTK